MAAANSQEGHHKDRHVGRSHRRAGVLEVPQGMVGECGERFIEEQP